MGEDVEQDLRLFKCWHGGEVVTLRSAKPPCRGSIPLRASKKVLINGRRIENYLDLSSTVLYSIVMPGRKRSWTNNQLEEAVKNSISYRQVLLKLNLREAG